MSEQQQTSLPASWIAIGDSFTEGYGDVVDGGERGWADLAAQALADARGSFRYANFAIRGRKLARILDEQLQEAIDAGPEMISINGGGNDIMRPQVGIAGVSRMLYLATRRIAAAGIRPVIVSGGNPSLVVPAGRLMQRRGDALAQAVRSWADSLGVTYVDNWSDATLMEPRFWSEDRLHLNTVGHAHAATNLLHGIGATAPEGWGDLTAANTAEARKDLRYYREFVMPWIGRRLTGRSSGDGRGFKVPKLVEITPR